MRNKAVFVAVAVAVLAATSAEACDLIDAGFDGSQVWWQIQGHQGEGYYQWVYWWNPDRGEWEETSEGQGRMLSDGVQTERLNISGHGTVKIVVQGDNKRTRQVDY